MTAHESRKVSCIHYSTASLRVVQSTPQVACYIQPYVQTMKLTNAHYFWCWLYFNYLFNFVRTRGEAHTTSRVVTWHSHNYTTLDVQWDSKLIFWDNQFLYSLQVTQNTIQTKVYCPRHTRNGWNAQCLPIIWN